jgi:SAM-dependent methyltransferase
MPREGKVLEAGCGLARYVEFLSKRGFDVIGIEASQDTVDMLRKLAPRLDVRQGDVRELPFEDGSMSGIISLGVVEHFFEGPRKPLKEMFRVLKPGHYAIITVPSYNCIRRFKHKLGIYNVNPVKLLKESNTIRKLFGKCPIEKSISAKVPYQYRHQHGSDRFFEYLFTKPEFEKELKNAGYTVIESVPIAFMDGVYHEFGKAFVSFKNWAFYPNFFGTILNRLLSSIPFFHNHMHLCVVRK